MRVIAGIAKGYRLKMLPSGNGTRPITDQGKESLFNILGESVKKTAFLDLFAGTGSVGIEALSRGAASACFVEQAPKPLKVIRSNLNHTRLELFADVVRADVFEFLLFTQRPYDIIFIAPPQYHELWSKTLLAIDSRPENILDSAKVIVQIDPNEHKQLELENLKLLEQRCYGNVSFCFYGVNA